MKTITIAAIALTTAFGPATAQAQRADRPVRERAAVRQQVEELEARYRRMLSELERHETDRAYLRELRGIEETLQRMQQQLRGAEVPGEPRVHVEMRALERAIEEHEARIAAVDEAREFQALRMAEVHQRQLHQRAQVEEVERALQEAQVRHRLDERAQAEHVERALQEAQARHRLDERAQVEHAERAMREAQAAHDRQRVDQRALVEEMERAVRDARESTAGQNVQGRARLEEVERALRAAERQMLQREHVDVLRSQELERALREADQAQQRERLLDLRRLRDRDPADAERLRNLESEIERMRERRLFEDIDIDAELDRLYRDGPREAWAQQDPADSLWRAARDRINRRDYDNAARLFARIHTQERYRRSAYRADALYWHAFALNRVGTRDAVRESLELLEQLIRQYPDDARHADTNGLLTTVQVRLAEMGNQEARQQVRSTAIDEVRVATTVETAVRADEARADRIAVTLPPGQFRAENVQGVNAVTQLEPVVAVPTEYRSPVYVQDGVVINSIVDASPIATWGLPASRLGSLSPQCAREESEIQLIALNSLVRMDTAAAMPVLREVMARRDECSAPLRQSAMTIIGRIRHAEADRILTETARNDPDTGVRRTALVYLSSRSDEQAVSIAAEALRTASDAEEQQWALQALARMRTDRAWSVVRDYAARSDLPPDTRRSAIAILGGSTDEANAAFLRSLYSRVGNDGQLKEAILMSTAMRRGADPEWLFGIAQDGSEDDRLREFAVMALSRNEELGTQRFVTLYDRSEDKRLKLALLRVLADRADSESAAVDKLISIARTEDDADLRKTAVLGLPASDPRARELLLEILRGS